MSQTITIEQARTKGTRIPRSIEMVQFRCEHWTSDGTDRSDILDCSSRVSFGAKTEDDIEYILIETEYYEGTNYFMVPLSELIRIGVVVEDTFVLPENWCVKLTNENLNVVGKFFDKHAGANCYSNGMYINNYLRCKDSLGRDVKDGKIAASVAYAVIPKGYTEITYDQFLKYVVGMKETRKIIGYKTPFDMFGGDVKKGTIYGNAENGNRSLEFFVPIEIVRTWEPVYEEEKITIEGYTAEKKNGLVAFGCYKFTKEQLEAYKHLLSQEGGLAKITVKEVNITVEMINKLLNLLK